MEMIIKTKCQKCGTIFKGPQCNCGWMTKKQKMPSNYYERKEYSKGSEEVANYHIQQIYGILGRNDLVDRQKTKCKGGTLNEKG